MGNFVVDLRLVGVALSYRSADTLGNDQSEAFLVTQILAIGALVADSILE